MTTTRTAEGSAVQEVAGWRIGFDRAARIGAIIGMIVCALQVAFAAYGFWVSSESGGDEAVGRAAFSMHVTTGEVLQYLAVALLICGLAARSGWKCWLLPLVMAVLLFAVQGPLVGLGFGVNPWFGALHALDGMLITAGFVWLAVDRLLHPLRR